MPLFGGHRPGRRRDHDDSKKGSHHRSRSRRSRSRSGRGGNGGHGGRPNGGGRGGMFALPF